MTVNKPIKRQPDLTGDQVRSLVSKLNFNPHPKTVGKTRSARGVTPFKNPHSKVYDEFDQRFPVVGNIGGKKTRRRTDRQKAGKGPAKHFSFDEPLSHDVALHQNVRLTKSGEVKFTSGFGQPGGKKSKKDRVLRRNLF